MRHPRGPAAPVREPTTIDDQWNVKEPASTVPETTTASTTCYDYYRRRAQPPPRIVPIVLLGREHVDGRLSFAGYIPLQVIYAHCPTSTRYPHHAIQFVNASMCETYTTFSRSSLSSSPGFDGLSSLDSTRRGRGRKRNRISSSDDDSDHCMLQERHYLLRHHPVTESDVVRRL